MALTVAIATLCGDEPVVSKLFEKYQKIKGREKIRLLKTILWRKVPLFARSHSVTHTGEPWLFPALFKEQQSPPDGHSVI